MTVERAYRQEGLTIAGLARQLGLPEYRLRRLINQGLGYRNFNSFVNHYRIAEAKAALGDAQQVEVPVLTIALDAGFSSLGPFNRAFKAETGTTPTDFRRASLGPLADSSKIAAFSESASRASNPARGNLAAS
jgi:AraC-like DNA-binding protein